MPFLGIVSYFLASFVQPRIANNTGKSAARALNKLLQMIPETSQAGQKSNECQSAAM